MSQKQANLLNKKKIAASIVVVSALAATGYEVNRLSANPVGEKDCPPVFAQNTIAIDTQIHVEIALLSAAEMLKWKQKGGTINDATNCWLRHPNCPARNVCLTCKTQGSMPMIESKRIN